MKTAMGPAAMNVPKDTIMEPRHLQMTPTTVVDLKKWKSLL